MNENQRLLHFFIARFYNHYSIAHDTVNILQLLTRTSKHKKQNIFIFIYIYFPNNF